MNELSLRIVALAVGLLIGLPQYKCNLSSVNFVFFMTNPLPLKALNLPDFSTASCYDFTGGGQVIGCLINPYSQVNFDRKEA